MHARRHRARRTLRRAILAALGLFATLAGCGKVVEQQVEKSMRQDLQRLIGPAQSYDVDIQGLSVASGTAEGATVTGTRVQLPDAPMLDRIDARMRDVRYDVARKSLQSVGSATAVVRLRPGDVADFLDKSRNMEDTALALSSPNEVTLSVRPQMSGLEIPAGLKLNVTGRLVGDGPRVRFEITRVGAGGLSVGGAVADALTRRINPIVDLSGMPIVVDVTNVQTAPDAITVTATGAYPRK